MQPISKPEQRDSTVEEPTSRKNSILKKKTRQLEQDVTLTASKKAERERLMTPIAEQSENSQNTPPKRQRNNMKQSLVFDKSINESQVTKRVVIPE